MEKSCATVRSVGARYRMKKLELVQNLAIAVLAAAVACGPPISRRTGVFAPKTPGYTYQDGLVAQQGKPLLRVVETDVDVTTTSYELRREGGSTEASVIFGSSYGGTLDVRAQFPALGVHYEVRMPIVPFTDLLASYIDNKVLVDGHVDLDGLKSYAAARGFQLIDTAAQIKRLDAAADRAQCRNCTQDFRKCEVEASYERQHPPPGVSYARSCETEFQTCSQGGILQEPSKWPCGAPPR